MRPQHAGYQVHVGGNDSGFCLDSAGGSQILVYPCYADKDQNFNQVWHIEQGHLVWKAKRSTNPPKAVELQVAPKRGNDASLIHLRTCSDKNGQRLRKHNVDGGSFALRDEDTKQCLGDDGRTDRTTLHLVDCGSAHRFKEGPHPQTFNLVGTNKCLDANDYDVPHLRPCRGGRTQRFEVDEKLGWVRVRHSWEDNGRRRFYERCLDSLAVAPLVVSVQPCDATAAGGIRWKRVNSRVPIETMIWNKAPKPLPDAPMLGGDAEPPT